MWVKFNRLLKRIVNGENTNPIIHLQQTVVEGKCIGVCTVSSQYRLDDICFHKFVSDSFVHCAYNALGVPRLAVRNAARQADTEVRLRLV